MRQKRSDNSSSVIAYGGSYKIVHTDGAGAAADQFERAASLIGERDYEGAQVVFADAVLLMEQAFDSMPFPVEVEREFEDRDADIPVWDITKAAFLLSKTARKLREGRALHAVDALEEANWALSVIYRDPEGYS